MNAKADKATKINKTLHAPITRKMSSKYSKYSKCGRVTEFQRVLVRALLHASLFIEKSNKNDTKFKTLVQFETIKT